MYRRWARYRRYPAREGCQLRKEAIKNINESWAEVPILRVKDAWIDMTGALALAGGIQYWRSW